MSLFINTNVASINAQRNLLKSSNSLEKTFNRLASGQRINSAKDDAAGLAIGMRFSSQIRGLNQSIRNANDTISLAQVAEGALDETTNALQRIRELAVQASNDTYSSSDRASLQDEVDQLIAEVNRIANNTEFNSQKLLNGSFSAKTFHVGAFSSQTITFSINNATANSLAVSGLSITSQALAENAISTIDNALATVAGMRSDLGALQNRFESIISNLSSVAENSSAAQSRIMDADVAYETANLTRASILQQAGTAVLAQANQQPQLALQLLG